jgi:hypothetical protein
MPVTESGPLPICENLSINTQGYVMPSKRREKKLNTANNHAPHSGLFLVLDKEDNHIVDAYGATMECIELTHDVLITEGLI